MAFVTDSNRPQPLWQPPPTACLIASGAASEVPSLLLQPCPQAVPRPLQVHAPQPMPAPEPVPQPVPAPRTAPVAPMPMPQPPAPGQAGPPGAALPYPDIPVHQVVSLSHNPNDPTTEDLITQIRRETEAMTSLMHEIEGVHVGPINYSPVTSDPREHPQGAPAVRGHVPSYQPSPHRPQSPALDQALGSYNPTTRVLDDQVNYSAILRQQQEEQDRVDVMAEKHEEVMRRAGFR